jgi:hypothetical protein
MNVWAYTQDFAAGQIHSSRLSRINTVSPCPNHVNVIPFFSIFDQTLRLSQRKLAILLATRATGFMIPGLNLVSQQLAKKQS